MEVVRSLYGLGGDAFLNFDADEADRAFRDQLDEQFEVRLPSDYPEGEPVFRGRAGAEEMFAMLADTWGKWRFELDRFVDAGERVVVFVRILAEGGASGVRSSVRPRMSGRFAAAAPCPCMFIGTARRPSKPWGCGSRRWLRQGRRNSPAAKRLEAPLIKACRSDRATLATRSLIRNAKSLPTAWCVSPSCYQVTRGDVPRQPGSCPPASAREVNR